MLAFEGLIAKAARDAGMKVPPEEQLDQVGSWTKEDYPHFHVFCMAQLGRPMSSSGEHWENAKVIAAIPAEDLKTLTLEDLASKGFQGL